MVLSTLTAAEDSSESARCQSPAPETWNWIDPFAMPTSFFPSVGIAAAMDSKMALAVVISDGATDRIKFVPRAGQQLR